MLIWVLITFGVEEWYTVQNKIDIFCMGKTQRKLKSRYLGIGDKNRSGY